VLCEQITNDLASYQSDRNKLVAEKLLLEQKIANMDIDYTSKSLLKQSTEKEISDLIKLEHDVSDDARKWYGISVKIQITMMSTNDSTTSNDESDIKVSNEDSGDNNTTEAVSFASLVAQAQSFMLDDQKSNTSTPVKKTKFDSPLIDSDTTYVWVDQDEVDAKSKDVTDTDDQNKNKKQDKVLRPVWKIELDDGTFGHTFKDCQTFLEQAYQSFKKVEGSKINLVTYNTQPFVWRRQNFNYETDWIAMTQTNKGTNRVRKIKRDEELMDVDEAAKLTIASVTSTKTVVRAKGLSHTPWPKEWIFPTRSKHFLLNLDEISMASLPDELKTVDDSWEISKKIPAMIPKCFYSPAVRYTWVPPLHSLMDGILSIIKRAYSQSGGMPSNFKIDNLVQIQNPSELEQYESEKKAIGHQVESNSTGCMKNSTTDEPIIEVPIFQSSSRSVLHSVCASGGSRGWAGSAIGKGYQVYSDSSKVITDSVSSLSYCFLVGTALVGRIEQFTNSSNGVIQRAPNLVKVDDMAVSGVHYHSTTDNINNPTMYNLWYSRQILYRYAIYFSLSG